jgi:hypothetical protein
LRTLQPSVVAPYAHHAEAVPQVQTVQLGYRQWGTAARICRHDRRQSAKDLTRRNQSPPKENQMSLTPEDREWIAAELRLIHQKIERVETTLLTEFHKWASPVEMRMRSHAATLRTLDIEIEAIGDRVTKLEKPAT